MKSLTKSAEGKHFAAAEAGAWKDLREQGFVHPKLGPVKGKLFLQKALGLTSMEVSLNLLPPGAGLPFYHRHREHEELYVFVGGRGQFQVDDQTLDVREGTVIRVSPEGERTWRNNSTENLYYVVVQARAGSITADATADGASVERPVVWP
jgi:mannose-6-phosphate isomerase-like protein (cupin superfamily)